MPLKDKIKIDSFKVDKIRENDLVEVLKLALIAQSSFGLTDKKAPSLFYAEIASLIRNNKSHSFVFKNNLNKIFAAFIIKPETNISAELALTVSDPNIAQTKEMYDEFIRQITSRQFKIMYAKVYKRRKRFQIYIKLLNRLGFNEIVADDENSLTLCMKKS